MRECELKNIIIIITIIYTSVYPFSINQLVDNTFLALWNKIHVFGLYWNNYQCRE